MAMEQRDKLIQEIHRIEGLLAYAEANGLNDDVEALRKQLTALLELMS